MITKTKEYAIKDKKLADQGKHLIHWAEDHMPVLMRIRKEFQQKQPLKNVTLAEEHLHDHFPGFPIMPECLMIEAMAQTAGILVGEARNFEEKVILAKIKKCVFFHYVRPGDTITIHAEIESIADEAASTTGEIDAEKK